MSRATNQRIAQGFSQGLQNFVQGYTKRKEKESAQKILDDPKSTPVQKAIAWESISEGSGQKSFDSFLKEQQLMKQEKQQNAINQELNGVAQDVGQRAEVGTIKSSASPVEYANQMLSPEQREQVDAEQIPPEQTLPTEPMTPAMQAMQQTQQQQQAPAFTQEFANQQQNMPKQSGIEAIPTARLQQLLQQADNAGDKGGVKRINSELKRRDTETKAEAIKDAAKISSDTKIELHNQTKVLDIQQDSEKTVESSSKALTAFNNQLAVVQKTGVLSRANFSKMLKDQGFTALGNAVQSGEGALFDASGKEIVGAGLKEAYGSKPLGVEFDAYMNALAQPGRDPKVNELTIQGLKLPYEIKNAIARFKMDLIADNPNISPIVLNSAAYRFGEDYRNQAIDAWEQTVRDTLNPEVRQKSTNAVLEDIFK